MLNGNVNCVGTRSRTPVWGSPYASFKLRFDVSGPGMLWLFAMPHTCSLCNCVHLTNRVLACRVGHHSVMRGLSGNLGVQYK